jgi:GntR family transcriptional regulator, transcriptional repressor for pyruvate dehydrogenase complex
MKKTDNRKTGELVAAGIRRRIATGDLSVGDRLPTEEELTESFGIARTTLREALRILEFQGLIHIRRGRGGGATVTMPDLERFAEPLAVILQLRQTTVSDLDAARSLLEPQLAAWLAKNHTDDDIATLRAIAARAATASDRHDRDAFGLAAAALHNAIIERAGNNTLSVMSHLLHRIVVDRYTVGANNADQAQMSRAVRSYHKLVELIAAGQAERARDHWHQQMLWVTAARPNERLDIYAGQPGTDTTTPTVDGGLVTPPV